VAGRTACLDRKGGPNKADTGWHEYDLEVLGSRWAHLRLATVAEDYAKDKSLLHCRLRAGWSLQGKLVFWGALGLELLLLGFLAGWSPAVWLLLLTVPLFAWYLAREKRKLQSLMVVFLDELAKELKITKVPLGQQGRDHPNPV